MSKRTVSTNVSLESSSIPDEEITLFQTDDRGIITTASQRLSDFTGLVSERLVGSNVLEIVSKKDNSKFSTLLQNKMILGKVAITLSLKGVRRNRLFKFCVEYLPGVNNRNTLLNWDLDSNISVEPVPSNNDLDTVRQMFHTNPQAVIISNVNSHQIIYANSAACELYDYTQNEFAQLSLNEIFDGRQSGKNSPVEFDSRFFVKENARGILLNVCISSILVNGENYHIIFSNVHPSVEKDIKNRKGFLQNVSNSPENKSPNGLDDNNALISGLKYAGDIPENALEIFFKLDTAGNFVFVSNEFESILGFTNKEINGRHFTSVVYPEDIEIARQGFADIFQFGRIKSNILYRVVKKNGGYEWFSTNGIFVFDVEGKPIHYHGFAQNVTEIKQLVEKLEASEERYAAFINHSSEAIWRFETANPLPINLPEEQLITEFIRNGYLGECNDQMARLYGFESAGDLTGMPLTKFLSTEDNATLEYFKGFIQSGFKLVNVETNETDKDGNQKIFLNNLMGIVENEKLVRVWGTQRDITTQRIAEKKAKDLLEQSETFFKSLISDSLDGIIIIDDEAFVTYAASSITNVLGYMPNEVIGKKCFEFIHPEDLSLALQGFSNQIKEVKRRYLELRFQSRKGEWVWMLVRGHNLYHQPAIKGMVIYFTNITQRKQSENILKESEKRFRSLADTLPVMIWVTDEWNKSTYVSKSWSAFTGLNLEKINSEVWKRILYPEDYQSTIDQYSLHFNSRQSFVIECRIRSADGDYKWVIIHGIPRFTSDRTFMGYTGSVMDIQYRKAAEQKLRYQACMIENIRDAIVSTDLDFNIIAWNSMAEEIYGLTKEEVMGKPIRSMINHEYVSFSREDVLIELYEKDSWEGEVYFDRFDGKRIYLFFSLSFVKNEKGERIGLVGIHRDITQRYESEMALRISEERYRSVVDALNEGIILQDKHGKIIACNKSASKILGKDLVGSFFKMEEWRCVNEDGIPFIPAKDPLTITLQSGEPLQGIIMGLQRPGNPFSWFSVNTEPIYYSGQKFLPDAIVTSFFDITQRKQQEQWLSLEKDVLEINAQPSASLKNTVDFYLKGIEKMFPDMICSILMLRDDKQRIQHLSAPSLPLEYSDAINGTRIGPKVGACGTAMYLKQRVITSDINTDPLWEDYKALAGEHNLQSCWSFPILNAQNEVLATFASYHKYPKVPSDKELNIMEVACNLLRIIIENKKAEANLRLSNERYLLATKATHDAIYDWDMVANTVYRGESFYSLFGYPRNQFGGLFSLLEEKLHRDDKKRVIKSLKRFIENKSPDIWESEYRFLTASGKYLVVYDRGFLIFNHEGNITRLVGSMMDITERKELEKRLVKQEGDKQKLVAQAVVDAQEKERAEIGKELHDNVNQILSTARLYLELAKSDENERLNLIKRSYDNIYDAINEIRSISRSLVPPSVGDIGLIESIQDLVENIRVSKNLYIEFCHEGNIDAVIGQKQKLMLFRIIQEQINNVIKHAEARNIIIELMIDGHMINLAISDDGKGFDYEKVKNNKGAGLQTIASRTELFNGKIHIVTAPNKGCKLNVHVPISKL